MKRIFIIMVLVVVIANAQAENTAVASVQESYAQPNVRVTLNEARQSVVAEDFSKALYIYSNIIEQQKKKRAQGYQVNNVVMAEYAYVLALTGAQEAAIVNLDLAMNLKKPSKWVHYYAGCILDVIGFGDYSRPYFEAGRQPAWLKGMGDTLNAKYRCPVLLSLEKGDVAITHISRCLKDGRNIEALCYSTALVQAAPDMEAAWILHSAVCERLGYFTYSLRSYEKGLSLIDDNDQPGMKRQLTHLQRQSARHGNRLLKKREMVLMIYGGLTYSNSYTSINGRFGACVGRFSYSVNLNMGLNGDGEMSSYCGLSAYYNFGKFFTGAAMGLQVTDYDTMFNFSPTIGVSFINARRTSSFDISIMLDVPSNLDADPTLGISIGKTFYINNKGKSK